MATQHQRGPLHPAYQGRVVKIAPVKMAGIQRVMRLVWRQVKAQRQHQMQHNNNGQEGPAKRACGQTQRHWVRLLRRRAERRRLPGLAALTRR